jgi:DNA-binding cell septation regulator SpoVG
MSQISNVKCWPLSKDHPTIKANGSFQVGDFVIKCTVRKGAKGLFVSLPSRSFEKDGKTEYVDEVFSLTKDTRDEVNSKLIAAFNTAKGNDGMNQGEAPGPTDQSAKNVPFG